MDLGPVELARFWVRSFRELRSERFPRFLAEAALATGRSRLALVLDCLTTTLRYDLEPLLYFHFGLPARTDHEFRRQIVGTHVFAAKYRPRLNPIRFRPLFDDKGLFRERYRHLMHPDGMVLRHASQGDEFAAWLSGLSTDRIFFKPLVGAGGRGSSVHTFTAGPVGLSADGTTPLADFLPTLAFPLLAEPYLQNHPALQPLSPTALASVRLLCFLKRDGTIEILYAAICLARGGCASNVACGGIAAPVDADTGVISGPATGHLPCDSEPYDVHPETGAPIAGFRIPQWEAAVDLVRKAAPVTPEVRMVGWDVVFTPDGPYLLEGNYAPAVDYWQRDSGGGRRDVLERLVASL